MENPRFTEEAIAKNIRLANLVNGMAQQLNVTPAQVALAWVLSRGVCAIPGTRHIARLEENWASQELMLNAEQIANLENLIKEGVAELRQYTSVMDILSDLPWELVKV